MQGFGKILVGVDLSHADRLATSELDPPMQEAIKRAIWLAGQVSGELTFLSVLDISPQAEELLEDDYKQASKNVIDEADRVLDALVDRAAEQGLKAKRKVVIGKDWVEIVREVLREQYDLVVVGTRDLGSVSRLLFGSAGMKLLRKCPCPVWITKPDPNWDDVNMLVASDLTEMSQTVLQLAIDGAQMFDAKVHLLHAAEYEFDQCMLHTGLSTEQVEAFRTDKRTKAEQQLQQQLAQTDYRTLTYGVQTHVIDGPADVVIRQAIEDFGIDLLVMGTVARGGIPGMLVGNTAERLLPEVNCSILAVKPPDFECPIKLD